MPFTPVTPATIHRLAARSWCREENTSTDRVLALTPEPFCPRSRRLHDNRFSGLFKRLQRQARVGILHDSILTVKRARAFISSPLLCSTLSHPDSFHIDQRYTSAHVVVKRFSKNQVRPFEQDPASRNWALCSLATHSTMAVEVLNRCPDRGRSNSSAAVRGGDDWT